MHPFLAVDLISRESPAEKAVSWISQAALKFLIDHWLPELCYIILVFMSLFQSLCHKQFEIINGEFQAETLQSSIKLQFCASVQKISSTMHLTSSTISYACGGSLRDESVLYSLD